MDSRVDRLVTRDPHRPDEKYVIGRITPEGISLGTVRHAHAARSSRVWTSVYFRTDPRQRAMRPRGPTAQPPSRGAVNATLLYATVSTIVHEIPSSLDTAVPASPTATYVARVPGTYVTPDM